MSQLCCSETFSPWYSCQTFSSGPFFPHLPFGASWWVLVSGSMVNPQGDDERSDQHSHILTETKINTILANWTPTEAGGVIDGPSVAVFRPVSSYWQWSGPPLPASSAQACTAALHLSEPLRGEQGSESITEPGTGREETEGQLPHGEGLVWVEGIAAALKVSSLIKLSTFWIQIEVSV